MNTIEKSALDSYEIPMLSEIFKDYGKEDLKAVVKLHQLKGYSKLNKAQLIDFLIENLLSKELMCKYFTFLSDDELEIIRKFSGFPCAMQATNDEMDNALALIEGGYCGANSSASLFIPKDVTEAFRANCDSDWKKERRKNQEFSWYLNGAAQLYGICPIEKALEIYKKYTNFNVDVSEAEAFGTSIPDNRKCFSIENGIIIHRMFFDKEKREILESEQKNKPYYIPTKREIELLGKAGHLPFDNNLQDLQKFFDNYLYGDANVVEDLCVYVQGSFRVGESVDSVIHYLEKNDIITASMPLVRLKGILHEIWKNTRLMKNRGNMPTVEPINNTYKSLIPLNLTSSSSAIAEPLDFRKKIYPNDPCPCGSGKKYKKCCGR